MKKFLLTAGYCISLLACSSSDDNKATSTTASKLDDPAQLSVEKPPRTVLPSELIPPN